MALIIGSTTIPEEKGKIVIGSTIIEKVNVISGGITTTVWDASATPYSVDLLSQEWISGWTTGYSGHANSFTLTSVPITANTCKHADYVEHSNAWLCTKVETKGCNKIKFKIAWSHYTNSGCCAYLRFYTPDSTIQDKSTFSPSYSGTGMFTNATLIEDLSLLAPDSDGYCYFDVPDGYDEFYFCLGVVDATAYFTAVVRLYSIEFYVE